MIDGPSITGLTHEVLDGLSSIQCPPCLSLYQTTHRSRPENARDSSRFRSLVGELQSSLHQVYSVAESEPLLKPFEEVANDREFWRHTLDGLVVLSGPGVFRALKLPQPVGDLAMVANSYHTRPLRRFLLSGDRFQVLALSENRIRLFEGNRRGLHELQLSAHVSRKIREALGPELTVTDFVDSRSEGGGIGSAWKPHVAPAESQPGSEHFFRAVDCELIGHYSDRGRLPLVLAALPHHDLRFREISQNPHLLPEGVQIDPDEASTTDLGQLAWQAVQPRYEVRLASLLRDFGHAQRKGYGSDIVADVASAAYAGRVGTMLIDSDLEVAGRLERPSGRNNVSDPFGPHVGDLLDDLGVLVAAKGGAVLVIPTERMPSTTGVAATFRF